MKLTFQDQIHFMSRQAQMLAEEQNDVSSKVMRDAMQMLIEENERAERYAATLRQLYREFQGREKTIHCRDGKLMVELVTEVLHA